MDDAPEQDAAGAEQWIPAPMRTGLSAIEPAEPDSDPHWSFEERAAPQSAQAADVPKPPRPGPAAELKELDGRLCELESAVGRTGERLDHLEQGSAGTSAALDGVGSVQAALTARLDGFLDRQEKLVKRVDSLDTLGREIGELRLASEKEAARAGALITRFEEKTSIILNEFRERLEIQSQRLSDTLDGVGSDQAALSGRLDGFLDRQEKLVKRVDSLDTLGREIGELRLASEKEAARAGALITRFEEKTSIILNEFRERLEIQSQRLSDAEQADRERLDVVESGLVSALAGLRSEIDEISRRDAAVREELRVLTEALTTRLGELGARVAELNEQRPAPAPAPPQPPPAQAVAPPPATSPPSSLDRASFEELRAAGLSVTQAARFIGFRSTLGRSLEQTDVDEIPGLQEELRERLRDMLG